MSEARRTWLELRLLCRPGVGIPAIASDLCRLIRRVVPYDAGAVAWLDDAGMPAGFFQENQPADLKELFANHYQDLFAGPGEYGVEWMLAQQGRTIGNWLGVADDVLMSNTYNLWMRPLGYRSLCEIRVEVEGRPKALFTFYREARGPFKDADLANFALIEPLLQRAAAPDRQVRWTREPRLEEYMVTNTDGHRLLSVSAGGEDLLRDAQLIGQRVSLVDTMRTPPIFAAELCAAHANNGLAQAVLPAGAGQLVVALRPMDTIRREGAPPVRTMLFTMHLERPLSVRVVPDIMALGLSPLRSELLQFAATGGRRVEVPRAFGISKEALKKHLAEIYRATGASEWDELEQALMRR